MNNLSKAKRVLAVLSGFFLIGSAHGTLIYSENFNSLDAGALDGQAGFSVATGNATYNVAAGGLTYTNGPVSHGGSGNQLNLVGGSNENPASVGFTEQTGDVYFSFLFQATGTDTFMWFAVSDDNDFNNSGGAVVGWTGGNNALMGRLRDGANQTTSGTAGAYVNDQTYLAVGRLSKSDPSGNYDTFSVLLNPNSLTEPAAWGQTVTRDIGISSVDTLVFRAGNSADYAYSVDDFRVGTSFDAVVIPEPSTLVLMGLAFLCGLVGLRRFPRR
jgi:hypothetical protein